MGLILSNSSMLFDECVYMHIVFFSPFCVCVCACMFGMWMFVCVCSVCVCCVSGRHVFRAACDLAERRHERALSRQLAERDAHRPDLGDPLPLQRRNQKGQSSQIKEGFVAVCVREREGACVCFSRSFFGFSLL